jgi:acyl-CoA thioester hydrolase
VTRLFVPVQLRWSDLDAYGHVNNVEMFRILEEARITAFWAHPQEPGQPGQLEQPGQPGQPGQLEQPEQPGQLEQPGQPGETGGPGAAGAPGRLGERTGHAGRAEPGDPGGPGPRAPEAWPTAVLDSGPGASSHTFVARQEIEYLRPLGFDRRPVRVEMWIGHMGGASLDVCYEVHDDGTPTERSGPGSTARPVARAVTTIVLVSAATGSPRRIAPHERAAWEPFLEQPVSFRRRGA